MSNLTARALDTWLNTLNKAHLVPVNAATFLRSVIAKQLGGPGFKPAPADESNFTDAELDALLRLAKRKDGTFGPITHNAYTDKFDDYDYGNGGRKLEEYFSPISSLSTSVGQMGYDKAKNALTDTYDFNREKAVVFDQGDGTFKDDQGDIYKNEDMGKFVANYYNRGNAYSNMRNNAHRFAHDEKDPDSSKIKFNVSIDKALKRLGKRVGTFDPNKTPSRAEFIAKAILAAGATGAPIGAALGATSGALSLINRKNRKHWARRLAMHTLAGAALGGIASGAIGGLAAHGLAKQFDKPFEKTSAELTEEQKRERRQKALANILAYGVPTAAVLGAGAYAGLKARNLYKEILANKGSIYGVDLEKL